MEFWFSENHTPNVQISIRVDKQLYSGKSEFQRIDVFDSPEFGRFLTLDGYMMLTSLLSVRATAESSESLFAITISKLLIWWKLTLLLSKSVKNISLRLPAVSMTPDLLFTMRTACVLFALKKTNMI